MIAKDDMRDGPAGPYRAPPAVTQSGSTLAFLRGAWCLDRRLTDHRHGVSGTFCGEAEFAATGDPQLLRYGEQGELRFGGHAGPAWRALLCRGLPGGAVDVRFADGREFYRLDLGSGRWRAKHVCAGRDDYVVTFRVLSPDLVEERWRVLGPDKDYVSVTTLRRIVNKNAKSGPVAPQEQPGMPTFAEATGAPPQPGRRLRSVHDRLLAAGTEPVRRDDPAGAHRRGGTRPGRDLAAL
jgi:Family of unknown function (DUF6314)